VSPFVTATNCRTPVRLLESFRSVSDYFM